MNIEFLNKKLDQYLKKTSGKKIISEFKKLGYKFKKVKK